MSPEVAGILILFVGGIYIYAKMKARSEKYFCNSCHHVGSMNTEVKGHVLIEIILWLAFLVPGIIYSIWRATKRKKECPLCKSTDIIPADSPKAKEILNRKSS